MSADKPTTEPVRRRWLLVIDHDGNEVRISLHPISLLRLVGELIEDGTEKWCRSSGHRKNSEGYCDRCGRSLPDDSPYGSWMRDAYRTIKPRNTASSGGVA